MKLLIDTHVWLWLTGELPDQTPAHIRKVLKDESSKIWLSVASVWEAKLKAEKGKLGFSSSPREAALAFEALGGALLAVTLDHAATALADPPDTKDLFDRLLLGQCEAEGMRLVTVDERLQGHRLAWRP